MTEHEIAGLVLFAEEGTNGTVAGSAKAIEEFKGFMREVIKCVDIRFKDSVSEVPPFHRVRVQIRSEIVGLKRPDVVPEADDNYHLTPSQWHDALSSDTPKVVIDTRNRYETLAGKFKGAIDPEINHFSEWSSYLDTAEIPNDVPVYMYCTGGIRCEKALIEMRSRGFDQVFQLRDGILGYLAEYPDQLFEGDCFVFDDRVALDQNLKPSGRMGICPGCGLPSDVKKECDRCDASYFVCSVCEENWGPVCSKQCRDLWQRHGLKQRA